MNSFVIRANDGFDDNDVITCVLLDLKKALDSINRN